MTLADIRTQKLCFVHCGDRCDCESGRPRPWDYEVHELSEGYSAIVYDANGKAVADHLTEAQAKAMVAGKTI